MPTGHCLTFDLHGGALALFLEEPLHFGFEDIANVVVSGIILLLLGVVFPKRNDKIRSRKFLIGSFSLFALKLSVFKYNGYSLILDIGVAFFILFLVVLPWWKVNNKYQHRALLLSFFSLFIVAPAYIFGVGSLLVPLIPRIGEGVFFGIMLVGLTALMLGMMFVVGRVARAGGAAQAADRTAGTKTKV